jgi:hypothetical protein
VDFFRELDVELKIKKEEEMDLQDQLEEKHLTKNQVLTFNQKIISRAKKKNKKNS